MAFVESISPDNRQFRSLHKPADCRYMVGRSEGRRILQLNSYGSPEREVRNQISQTLQFDERSAKQLFDLLRAEYGF